MKFEILNDEMFAVPANGYVLDLDEKCENVKRGEVCDEFGYPVKANLDSFFDLDNAKLCRGDDGELYAVEFKPLTHEPLIWCKVRPMTIKEARRFAGITQEEMSERFEIPKRTIEDWERGAMKPPEYVKKLIVEKLCSFSNK